MLSKEKIDTLNDLYSATGLPFLIAHKKNNDFISFPEESREYYSQEYWSKTKIDFSRSKHPDGVSLISVGDTYHVALVNIDEELFYTSLPISSYSNAGDGFLEIFKQGFVKGKEVEFYRFLASLPNYDNPTLVHLASLAKYIVSGKNADGVNLFLLSDISKAKEVEFQYTPNDDVRSNQFKHIDDDSFKDVLDAISEGNTQHLKNALSRPRYGQIGKMSLNSLRQAKYEFVCFMYACSRAAIKGGLDPEYSFELSDIYCQRMDGMENATIINSYMFDCAYTYCDNVAKASHAATYSKYTNEACDYIRNHLLNILNVQIIADHIGINRRSLSMYFKDDTGMMIKEYIMDCRLKEAANLLKNTTISIIDISTILQFSSQSFFTQQFKKKYGVTPLKYRLTGEKDNQKKRTYLLEIDS
ncbi:MAG: helix-turn-helix transcriptional regulator [Erysipelotrichaceae bacterium]|nr:helix-turn-helix transcriptional regulator [Erysipelotrichaceae bacterium]